MNELIQSIVTVGGFGYANYLFYERISDRNFKTDMDKKFFIGTMTSVNYLFYLIGSLLTNNLILSILVALCFSFILTLIMPWVVDKIFWFTNKIRSKKGMSEQDSKKVYKLVFSSNQSRTLFIYSIPDNQFISSGYAKLFSGEEEDFTFDITPLYWNDPARDFLEEKELQDFLDKKNIEADIYINFDKKIKVICYDFVPVEVDEAETSL